MNRADFLRLVRDPESITAADVQDLEEVVQAFPYFGLAHMLLAKSAHISGDMLAPQKLRKAAVFAPNRVLLKRLLQPEPAVTPAIVAESPDPQTAATKEKIEAEIAPLPKPSTEVADSVTTRSEITNSEIADTDQEYQNHPKAAPTSVTEEETIAQEILAVSEITDSGLISEDESTSTVTEVDSTVEPEIAEVELGSDQVLVSTDERNASFASRDLISNDQVSDTSTEIETLPAIVKEEDEFVSKEEFEAAISETDNEIGQVLTSDTAFQEQVPVATDSHFEPGTAEIIAEEINSVVISEPETETLHPVPQESITPETSAGKKEITPTDSNLKPDNPDPVEEVFPKNQEADQIEIGTQPEIGQVPALQESTADPSDFENELRIVFADPALGYALDSSRLGEGWAMQDEAQRELPFYPQLAVPIRKEPASNSHPPEPEIESPPAPVIAIQQELIDSFLKQSPRRRAQAASQMKEEAQEDLSAKSTKLSPAFVSESLAQIFVKQGKVKKAIKIYQQLQLKMPEKSEYFANQILLLQQQF